MVGGLAVVVVVAVAAPRARADRLSPLTELVGAAAQRLQIAEPVAAFKWSTHGAVEDPARVQQELANLSADATGQHIDPAYITRVFGDQINATEAIEYSRFADWKLNPDSVPAGSPDLSSSRSSRCWPSSWATGTCCIRRDAPCNSTLRGVPSSGPPNWTVFINGPSRLRAGRIASDNLIFSH